MGQGAQASQYAWGCPGFITEDPYSEKSFSLKQTETVGHHCPKSFPTLEKHDSRGGKNLPSMKIKIFGKQPSMCKSTHNFLSISFLQKAFHTFHCSAHFYQGGWK